MQADQALGFRPQFLSLADWAGPLAFCVFSVAVYTRIVRVVDAAQHRKTVRIVNGENIADTLVSIG